MFGLDLTTYFFPEMTQDEFNYFRSKIYSLAGISMNHSKKDLVQGRLRHRILFHNLQTFSDYRTYLEKLPLEHAEWEEFINLLTTNKTDWFREPKHFDFITQDFLPRWKLLGKKHLNIWCAASSTGEEPYTLSLVLQKALLHSGITYQILATDIDTKVLAQAKNGVYPKERLQQIPEHFHHCFQPGKGEIFNWMKVRKEIKAPVEFDQFNLIDFPYTMNAQFDLILCRNVLIYFDKETIRNVVSSLHQQVNENGVLLIAHAESLQNTSSVWKYVRPSIYQKGKLF